MRHHERLHGDKATLIEGTWGAELARLEAETRRIKADPSVSECVKDYANYCWQGIQAGLREYMKNPGERAAQLLVEVGEIFQPFAQGARQVAQAGDGKRVANDLVEGGVALGLDYMMVAAFGPAGYAANAGAKGVTKIAKGANKFGKFLWGVHEAAVERVMAPQKLEDMQLRAYVREMERVSTIPVSAAQRDLLFDALRARPYTKIVGAEKAAHSELYTASVNKRLIAEWEMNIGKIWPRYESDVINPGTGKLLAKQGKNHRFHHIIPQEYAGPHAWWNGHPVAVPGHRSVLYGKGSELLRIFHMLE